MTLLNVKTGDYTQRDYDTKAAFKTAGASGGAPATLATLSTAVQSFSLRDKVRYLDLQQLTFVETIDAVLSAIELIENLHNEKQFDLTIHSNTLRWVWSLEECQPKAVAVETLVNASPCSSAKVAAEVIQKHICYDICKLGKLLFDLFAMRGEDPTKTVVAHELQSRTLDAQNICRLMMDEDPERQFSLEEARNLFKQLKQQVFELQNSYAKQALRKESFSLCHNTPLQAAYLQNAFLHLPATTRVQQIYRAVADLQRHPIAYATLAPIAITIDVVAEERLQKEKGAKKTNDYLFATGHMALILPRRVILLASTIDPVFEAIGGSKHVTDAVDLRPIPSTGLYNSTSLVIARSDPDLEKTELTNLQSLQGCKNVIQLIAARTRQIGAKNYKEFLFKKYKGTFADFNTSPDRFSLDEKLQAAIGVISGTLEMHEKNMAHLDLKFGNLFYTKTKGSIESAVGDLGYSTDFSQDQPLPQDLVEGLCGAVITTPPEVFWFDGYESIRPPEEFFAVDIYALGFTLYYLFASRNELLTWPPLFVQWDETEKIERTEELHEQLRKQILNEMHKFEATWKQLAAKNPLDPIKRALIVCAQMMAIDPEERLPLAQAREALLDIKDSLRKGATR